MMTDDRVRQVAAALDATPDLVPHLAELLADLWELGGSAPLVAGWLGQLGPLDASVGALRQCVRPGGLLRKG